MLRRVYKGNRVERKGGIVFVLWNEVESCLAKYMYQRDLLEQRSSNLDPISWTWSSGTAWRNTVKGHTSNTASHEKLLTFSCSALNSLSIFSNSLGGGRRFLGGAGLGLGG